jgi:ankyrin repeat protein
MSQSRSSPPGDRGTFLHLAVETGNLAMVQILISNGADVNALDIRYETPLMVAAANNHLTIAQELLSQGADPEMRDIVTFTAMAIAVSRGNTEIAQLLESASPYSLQFTTASDTNMLGIQIFGNSPAETFMYLISRGVDPHHRDRHGYPMLSRAMLWGYARYYLIPTCQTSFSPVSKEPMSFNPLAKIACQESPLSLKRLFFSLSPATRQALVGQDDNTFGTPLCAAASRGNLKTVKLLVTLGADIEQCGSAFGTPVMCAIVCGRFEIVKFLVREGARLEYSDEDGYYRSGLKASIPHPKITHWLLVGKYQDQRKLANSSYGTNQMVKQWSGKRTIKVALLRFELRAWGESTLDYCIRLCLLKQRLIGGRVTGELV